MSNPVVYLDRVSKETDTICQIVRLMDDLEPESRFRVLRYIEDYTRHTWGIHDC